MNRETRAKFTSTTSLDPTTGNACWETAPAIAAQLDEDFGPFDIDLTADSQRHLCPVWFGPGSDLEEDALAADWSAYGKSGFSNPPYGRFVPRILAKAATEAERGFTSHLLLPLRVTRAFRNLVLSGAADLIFPDKRLVFFEDGVPRCSMDKRGRLHPDTALFDSVIVCYRPYKHARPRISEWHVPQHVFPADLERAMARHQAAVIANIVPAVELCEGGAPATLLS